MADFPDKRQTNPPCSLLSLESRLISLRTRFLKILLIPWHTWHSHRTVRCTKYFPAFPWIWNSQVASAFKGLKTHLPTSHFIPPLSFWEYNLKNHLLISSWPCQNLFSLPSIHLGSSAKRCHNVVRVEALPYGHWHQRAASHIRPNNRQDSMGSCSLFPLLKQKLHPVGLSCAKLDLISPAQLWRVWESMLYHGKIEVIHFCFNWVLQAQKLTKTHLTALHIALINKMFLTGNYKVQHNNMKGE